MAEDLIYDIEDLENEEQQLFEHWKIEVDKGQTPVRIDKFLAEKNPYQSRIVFNKRLIRAVYALIISP